MDESEAGFNTYQQKTRLLRKTIDESDRGFNTFQVVLQSSQKKTWMKPAQEFNTPRPPAQGAKSVESDLGSNTFPLVVS